MVKPSSSSATLGLAPDAVYTAPKSAAAVLRKVTACNTGTSARAVTVHLIPSGGSANVSNTVVSAASVPAGSTVDLELADHSIDAGGTVTAYSDGQGAVALRVSVLEVPL